MTPDDILDAVSWSGSGWEPVPLDPAPMSYGDAVEHLRHMANVRPGIDGEASRVILASLTEQHYANAYNMLRARVIHWAFELLDQPTYRAAQRVAREMMRA